MRLKHERIHLPVSIDGHAADYLLDTGAGTSAVSESEARRLGLKLEPFKTSAVDAVNRGIAVRHAGVAGAVQIGGCRLRRVVFLVFPDSTPWFAGRPVREQGILGLPEIRALGSVRWNWDGDFECGLSSQPGLAPNLAFQRDYLVAEVRWQDRGLTFNVDTGGGSNLFSRFREFAGADAVRATVRTGGATGEVEMEGIVMESLRLYVGGGGLLLAPAVILTREDLGPGLDGSLGLSLLSQAQWVTLDFPAMRLTLGPERR